MTPDEELKAAEANVACANTCLAVMEGLLDDRLNDLVEAITARRDVRRVNLAIKNRTEIKVSMRVRLINCAPQYLLGKEGVVTESIPGQFRVKLDRPVGKFTNGIVLVKPQHVELAR